MIEKKDVNTVFVGAGPVGLASAIAMKRADPTLNIEMIERYTEYERSHNLKLQLSSVQDLELHNKIVEFAKKPNSGAILKGGEVIIPIQALEKLLKDEATKLGINFRNSTLVPEGNPENKSSPLTKTKLLEEYPNCKLFIGADGAHSEFRSQFFGSKEQYKLETPLQYTVQFKYRVKGKASKLSMASDYKTNKIISHMCFEHVGKYNKEDDYTDISLQFFVNKKEYDSLGAANAKSPASMDSKLPEKLMLSINVWLNARKAEFEERVVEVTADSDKKIQASPSLTKTMLSVYHAPQYAKSENGKVFALVGDAAFGVPYFRSLNNGFLTSTNLAKDFSKASLEKDPVLCAKNYNDHTEKLYNWEATRAKLVNLGLMIWSAFVTLWSLAFVQFIYWDKNKQNHLRKTHELFEEAGQGENVEKAASEQHSLGKVQIHHLDTKGVISKPSSSVWSPKMQSLVSNVLINTLDVDRYFLF